MELERGMAGRLFHGQVVTMNQGVGFHASQLIRGVRRINGLIRRCRQPSAFVSNSVCPLGGFNRLMVVHGHRLRPREERVHDARL